MWSRLYESYLVIMSSRDTCSHLYLNITRLLFFIVLIHAIINQQRNSISNIGKVGKQIYLRYNPINSLRKTQWLCLPLSIKSSDILMIPIGVFIMIQSIFFITFLGMFQNLIETESTFVCI